MAAFSKGQPVWLLHQTDRNYPEKAGEVLKATEDDVVDVKIQPGWENTPDKITVDNKAPFHLLPMSLPPGGVDDMMKLTDLYVGALLHNLKMRYNNNIIYTYIGSILVAVNPFQNLNLTTLEYKKKYENCDMTEMPPHVFAIASEAYKSLQQDGKNQSVVISGESGAGKSESTKHVLQFLAHKSSVVGGKETPVEEQIVRTSEILEAFGNACTTRNNNSSRFGKFVEVQFDEKGVIVGAHIEQYLLEKSRVVLQNLKERNYHIFYLLYHSQKDWLAHWQLPPVESLHYLNQGQMPKAPGIDDAEFYNAIHGHMLVLNLSDEVQQQIFTVMAAILHLGNVRIDKQGRENLAVITDRRELEQVARLLEVEVEPLAYAICNTEIEVPGKIIQKPLTDFQAYDNRDAFAKGLYHKVFENLVERINATTARDGVSKWIGVLDIFGFEHFHLPRTDGKGMYANNSFEQFCINYANEMLQNFFNYHIFLQEQKLYTEEHIPWDKFEIDDNEGCLQLIDEHLGILDECSNSRQDITNEMYLQRLHGKYDTTPGKAKDDAGFLVREEHRKAPHQFYARIRPNSYQTDTTDFVVAHYAGDVQYSVCKKNKNDKNQDPGQPGFIEKNKDRMVHLFFPLLQASRMPFLADLFARHKETKTVAGVFKASLQSLTAKLKSTNPFFIRCVKPNLSKVSQKFENDLVLMQLRAAGMLETINIRNAGYPQRMKPPLFMERYDILVPLVEDINETTPEAEAAAAICDWCHNRHPEAGLQPWTMGTTMVFMKEHFMRILEKERAEAKKKIDEIKKRSVVHLVALARMFLAVSDLKARKEEFKRIKARLERIKALVATGLTPEEAKAQVLREEEDARRAEIEARRVAVVGPIETTFRNASKQVAEIVATLTIVISDTKDPAQGSQCTERRSKLEATEKAAREAFDALARGWEDPALVEAARAAASELAAVCAREALGAPQERDMMFRRAAELERQRLEAERLERERQEEAERAERERIAAEERAERERKAAAERAAREAREAAEKAERDRRAAAERAEAERLRRLEEERRRIEEARLREEKYAVVRAEQERIAAQMKAAEELAADLEVQRARILEERAAFARQQQAAAEKEAALAKVRAEAQARREQLVAAKAAARQEILEQKEQAKRLVMRDVPILWKGRRGTIQYCGRLPIAGSKDMWLGLEMDDELPEELSSDGSCLGVHMFVCEPRHGVFVRAEQVELVQHDAPMEEGARVVAPGGMKGVVQYLGPVHTQEGEWAGVELDLRGTGKNDGEAHGRRYFTCAPKTGIFIRPDRLCMTVPWNPEFLHTRLMEHCIAANLLTEEDRAQVAKAGHQVPSTPHDAQDPLRVISPSSSYLRASPFV